MTEEQKTSDPGISDKFSLEKFVPVVFVFSIGLIILIGIFSYTGVKEFESSRNWVSHTYIVKDKISEIYFDLVNLKELEFLSLNHKDSTRSSIEAGQIKSKTFEISLSRKINELKELVIDNPEQEKKADELEKIIQLRINYAQILLTEALKQNPQDAKINQWYQESTDLRFPMRKLRDEMTTNEDKKLIVRNDEMDNKVSNTEKFILVSTLIGFIIIIFSVYITSRLFSSRNEAHEKLRESNADLEKRIELRTKDLSVSRNRFNTLFDSDMAGVMIINSDYKITEANSAFLSLIGCTYEDLPLDWSNVTTIDSDKLDELARQSLKEKGFAEPYQKKIRKKDGTIIDILLGAATLKEEKGKTLAFILDISDRIRIQKDLEQREKQLTLITDAIPALISYVDKDEVYRFTNINYEKWFGKSKDSVIGMKIKDLIKDSYPNFYPSIERAMKGEHVIYEAELKTLNEVKTVQGNMIPNINESGEFEGFFSMTMDITALKKQESAIIKANSYLNIQYNISRALSESDTIEEAYEKVLTTIVKGVGWDAGIIWVDDKQGSYLLSNIIYSLDPDGIFGLKKSVPVRSAHLSSKVFATKSPIWVADLSLHHNYEFEDNSNFKFISAFAFPIISNNKVLAIIECFSKASVEPINDLLDMLYSTGRQIGTFIEKKNTELLLRKANDELEEQVTIRTTDLNNTVDQLKAEIEQRLKVEKEMEILAHTIKSSNDLIWITDLNNKIVYVNKAFEEVYGYMENELIDQDISVIRNEDPEVTLEISKETMKGGWQGELSNKRKDDSTFPVRVSTSLVKDAEGKPRAIVGIAVDITDIRIKEETIATQNAKLQLMQEITVVANKTFNINEALSFTIDKICEVLHWDIGHAYIVDKEEHLKSTKIWNKNIDEKFKEFKFVSENTHFAIDEGIPGHIRYTGKSLWIEDLEENQITIRKKYFRNLKIQSGLAFPIVIEDEVTGILEFYSVAKKPVNQSFLEAFENIGTQLGRVVERKIALDNIVTSESKFRAVSETALDGIIILDKNDKIYFVNESIVKNFGYLRKELIGESLSKITDLGKNNDITHLILTSRNSGMPLELRGFKKDGTGFPMEVSSSTWYDKKEKYTTFIIRNISERKKAEEEIKNNEQLLKEAQSIAHLGSWTWELETGERIFSDEILRIYGFEPGDKVDAEDIKSRIIETDIKDTMHFLEESIRLRKPHNYLQRAIMPTGEMKILSCRGDVVVDENDVVKRIYGTVQDVTELRIKEQELLLTNKKLQETQKELIHNEKLAVLGRFSSGIAHEIRNPLANISALAQLLVKAPLEEKMKKHLKYIMINTDIANKIIKDLLNYASPDVNQFRNVDMNLMLDKMKNMVKPRCDKYDVKLITKFEDKLPVMYIEEKKLESAFFNFISNAIEAMEEGGKLEFKARFENDKNEIVINFIDTGIGISQDNIDKIFEPFFTTKDTGTGLGMALASQTIKIHNGSLNIRSVPGEGTDIEVRLPVINN